MSKNEPSQVDQTCKIFLASGSKVFLEGIQKILENESDMEISGETSNPDEVKRHIIQIKPGFLFFDNRTLHLNIHNLLNLITEKSPRPGLFYFVLTQKMNLTSQILFT
ncbi:MAG: response regulator transcription factor [Deltaproteobacteria bacterium]|nr:response regulator transcription factor [Deltaproteobacteria bacterium]